MFLLEQRWYDVRERFTLSDERNHLKNMKLKEK